MIPEADVGNLTSAKHLNWEDLRIFVEMARATSLAMAAKRLGIDQSTVSRRIAHLELCIGASLFERTPKGLQLNTQGHQLLACAQPMDTAFVNLAQTLGGQRRELVGPVRLGTMEGIASLYLTRHLARFNRDYPGIMLELVTSTQQLHVTRREADIFLSFFEPHGSGLDVEHMGRFALHLYASPAYVERHGEPASVADLANHAFVGYIDDLVQIEAVRWLEEAVDDPHIVFHSSSMLAQMFAAAAGSGLVLLPAFTDAERFGLYPVLADAVQVRRDLWLSVHHDLRYVPRIKTVVAFLQRLFRDDPIYAC
ncbi:LysR family transcriptional regulator [Pseudomonas dryadis]|uniref:LysR family transcriptional regulator n=1 Tax=Phytopseudomonas dryadis TaxID=2487520 RepID=A0A4V2KBH0_9GAMM|nr:LysR family transcriptional regulator [Pseudomonas dryadis]TBV00492.1 LysR family transcriptional regulator [Pseudomonas dryadis]TBV13124.1 LysR family transcriptional regulator [Pseudomonas sp. FRB 230]